MRSWLIKLLAGLAAIGGFSALLFRAKEKQAQAEATRDRQRAEAAEASSATHQRIAERSREVEQRHRAEQADSQERLDAGLRDHFEDDWR